MLPDYIAKASPRPAASRAPWQTNTAPTYAGVFYGAWAAGFLVGIVPFLPGSDTWKQYFEPATVYSAITGFVVYAALAKSRFESGPVGEAAQ